MGSSQLQFQIAVQVSVSSSVTSSTETLSLSPSTPTVLSSVGNVSAVLLGDLANYQAAPDFGYAILMIPSPAGGVSLWLHPLLCQQVKLVLGPTICLEVGTKSTVKVFKAILEALRDLHAGPWIGSTKRDTLPSVFCSQLMPSPSCKDKSQRHKMKCISAPLFIHVAILEVVACNQASTNNAYCKVLLRLASEFELDL